MVSASVPPVVEVEEAIEIPVIAEAISTMELADRLPIVPPPTR
jgi:hypothetical protein